jgi:hypothetical protein
MKTFGRILMILIAALMVIGATYAISQTSAAQAVVGQPMGQSGIEDQSAPPDFANGQSAPAGEMRGGDHEGSGGSWTTVERNLLEMAAIILIVQVLWSIGRRMKRAAEKNHRWQWGRQ